MSGITLAEVKEDTHDFLMEFYNMSFPEAVKTLINESPGEDKQEVKKMEQEDAGSHEGCPIPSEKSEIATSKSI